MGERGLIQRDEAGLFGYGLIAASALAVLLAAYSRPCSAQGIEKFFTHPRLAQKNPVSKTATDALALSQEQALWSALAFENNDELRQLLKKGVSPNKPEELSLMTPLMAAETLPLAWTLIEAGADARARDRLGRTPLHYAAKMREAASIIPLLVRAGGDINARASEFSSITPLFSAVENYLESPDRKGAATVLRVLVRLGADINASDDNGATVLAIAAAHNEPDLIRLLVELGADPARRLGNGRTPLDYAREANATDAIHLLDGVVPRSSPAN
jgi:ankyrin repeat protein